MKSNKLEIIPSQEPLKGKQEEEIDDEQEKEQQGCLNNERFLLISNKIRWRTFLSYSIVSFLIFLSRMSYITIVSRELDLYGQNYETKYRLIDFQKMTEIFFSNFDYQLNQSKHALDVINDIYNIAEVRYNDYDFLQFSRCHLSNITLCISNKKDEEITYKLRTDSFYKIYYFHTSSVYVTDQDDDSSISASQNLIVSKTSMFENFYFNIFSHFHFVNNLHHKMFIVFPNDKVARIFPVQYNSNHPLSSNDYTIIKNTLKGNQPNLHWKTSTSNKYSIDFSLKDYIQTEQNILRISRVIKRNSDNVNVGAVSIDIFNSHLNSTFSNLLGSNYATYLIDIQGNIIQTNIENFSEQNIFSSLQGCYCNQIIQKFKSLSVTIQDQCQQPKIPFSEEDCKFFNMKELWLSDGNYMFFLVTVRDSSFVTDTKNQLLTTIIIVYVTLFICLFFAIIYFTNKTIEEFTTDITNPIKQISFKIQRIMHNIFNPKQFSKIRTDEIVIREKTEIRKLAIKFGETFQRLNEKNLFQTTIVSSIDKSYQKSKEISDKPQKDTIVDEVRNIVQQFLDDQQLAINEQTQQQERNKYARSNKSRNNLDASILRE